MPNDRERSPLDDFLSSLPKEELTEWDKSLIRQMVNLAEKVSILSEKLEELKKSKAERVEVWWLRFLFLSAMSAVGAVILALLPSILFKGHGS